MNQHRNPHHEPQPPADGLFEAVITDVRAIRYEGRPATRVGTVIELPDREARRLVLLFTRPLTDRDRAMVGRRLAVKLAGGQPMALAPLTSLAGY